MHAGGGPGHAESWVHVGRGDGLESCSLFNRGATGSDASQSTEDTTMLVRMQEEVRAVEANAIRD
jgi:hypothetical protein